MYIVCHYNIYRKCLVTLVQRRDTETNASYAIEKIHLYGSHGKKSEKQLEPRQKINNA